MTLEEFEAKHPRPAPGLRNDWPLRLGDSSERLRRSWRAVAKLNEIADKLKPQTEFEAFAKALEALCIEHKVHLCTAREDEAIEAWPIDMFPGALPAKGVENCLRPERGI